MNPLLLYVSIAQSIANAVLKNKGDSGKVSEWMGYLNLASAIAARFQAGSTDLKVLDDQIKEAVTAGRGLTIEQRAEWRGRDDIATEVSSKWLADHPK